jgi:hypothetical protein
VQSVLALTVLVVQELAQWYATPDGHVWVSLSVMCLVLLMNGESI